MTTYLRKNTNFLYGDKHQFKVFNNDGEISENGEEGIQCELRESKARLRESKRGSKASLR